MQQAFEQLGLPVDADERAIKRAYAQRLKTTRPDEDPQGFQRLREAYEAALLAHARARHAAWVAEMEAGSAPQDADAAADALPATGGADGMPQAPATDAADTTDAAGAGPTDAERGRAAEADGPAEQAPERVEIALGPVFEACLEAAMHEDPRLLRAWLQDEPLLWSLQHKPVIGRLLLQMLDERSPCMPARNFDSIAGFFGWSDLHTGFDPMALNALRTRLDTAWREWRIWGRGGEASRPATDIALEHSPQVRLNFEQTWQAEGERPWVLLETARHSYPELCADMPLWRELLRMLLPGYAREVMGFARRVQTETADELPHGFRRDRIRFWSLAADDTRWSRPRAKLAAVRSMAAAIALSLVFWLGAMWASPDAARQFGVVLSVWITFGLLMAIWLVAAALKSFALWQSRPPRPDWRRRLAHTLTIPALVLSMWSLVDEDVLDSPVSLAVLAIAATLGPVVWTRLRCGDASRTEEPPRWRHHLHVGCWLWLVFALVPLQLVSHHVPTERVAHWVFGLVAVAVLAMWSAGLLRERVLQARRKGRGDAT